MIVAKDAGSALPRLVYIGEVPVESSYHGSALLYRLLQRYPEDQLRIVEVLHESQSTRRLTGVRYELYRPRLFRLLSTRFHDLAKAAFTLLTRQTSMDLERNCMEGFEPQAVLTVAHGLGWMAAAAIAAERRIPLHMIVHDDWPGTAWTEGWVNHLIARHFAKTYRAAASRLCVSPYMADEYEKRYGPKGIVLYPSRAADAEVFSDPPLPPATARPFTVGYAGTLYPDHAKTLQVVAVELARIGGRLLLFGPIDSVRLADLGLDQPNVDCGGLVSSEELVRRLREEADVLFVPMSFSEDEREAARFSFPSKLADYTRAGLPLFIAGPPESSAVRWALSNPGVAEVAQLRDTNSIGSGLSRLADDEWHRRRLAIRAIECGGVYFSHATAEKALYAQLTHFHASAPDRERV